MLHKDLQFEAEFPVFAACPLQGAIKDIDLHVLLVELRLLFSPMAASGTCQGPATGSPYTATTATGHRCGFRRSSDERVIRGLRRRSGNVTNSFASLSFQQLVTCRIVPGPHIPTHCPSFTQIIRFELDFLLRPQPAQSVLPSLVSTGFQCTLASCHTPRQYPVANLPVTL